jgi:hypothetical protein
MGVWVAFFNSPHCLVKHPKQKKYLKKLQMNQKKFKKNIYFFGWRSARQCISLLKKRPKPPMLDIPFAFKFRALFRW